MAGRLVVNVVSVMCGAVACADVNKTVAPHQQNGSVGKSPARLPEDSLPATGKELSGRVCSCGGAKAACGGGGGPDENRSVGWGRIQFLALPIRRTPGEETTKSWATTPLPLFSARAPPMRVFALRRAQAPTTSPR